MKLIVGGLCVLASMGAMFAVNADDAESRTGPVPVSQINEHGVEGHLGVRLGKIVKVSGTVVPNTSRAKADSAVPYFLSIETVDGRTLKKPVLYPFAKANQWVKALEPEVGERFRFVGYETGKFTGSPAGEFDYVPSYASTGYAFVTSFFGLATETSQAKSRTPKRP